MTPTRRSPWRWFLEGGWYFLVVLGSVGILTPIPFAHAAVRLRTRWAWATAAAYTLAIVVLLAATNGPPEAGRGNLQGGLLLGLIVVALVHLVWVRTRVWPRSEKPDAAVTAALAARERRAEARRIVERDPELARELRIGRPDLPREYDDGGLVDLNSAPAAQIARRCDIPRELAERIVAARRAGAPFARVDDAFTYTDIPVGLWDRIRERAVALPD